MAAPFRLAPLVLAGLLSACASRSSNRPANFPSSKGPALESLWKASGGLAAWRKIGSVRFTYQAEVGPAAVREGLAPEAMASLGGGSGRPAMIGPRTLAYEPGNWRILEIGGEGDDHTLSLDGPPHPDLPDYAFRAARVLALFSFNLADPAWEFRWDLIAGRPPDPFRFKAVPDGAASPHTGYLVEMDPGTGLLRAVWYEVQHPCFRGKIFMAVFGRYQTFHGFQVATEISHFSTDPASAPGGYPWEPSPAPREDDGLVLRERISSMEFIDRPEVEGTSPGAGSAP